MKNESLLACALAAMLVGVLTLFVAVQSGTSTKKSHRCGRS